MRRTVLLGFGLLVAGAALVLASTGGFDSAIADRNTDLADAPDDEALLNVTYPNGQPVELESSNSDNFCFFAPCQYYDRELFVLSDNTSAGELQVTAIDFVQDSDSNLDIVDGPTADQSAPTVATVTASFECPDSGFFAPDQDAGSGWTEMDVTVSDGNLTIQTTRRLDIECVPD